MSTPLPLAGELADDLLCGADAIGAYLFGREDAQRAQRAGELEFELLRETANPLGLVQPIEKAGED